MDEQIIKGVIISYYADNNSSRTIMNHKLFGRLVYKSNRGKKIAYYVPGLLDNIPFARLLESKIFVEENLFNVLDRQKINALGNITVEEAERNSNDIYLRTGREHWQTRATERGCIFRVIRTKRN